MKKIFIITLIAFSGFFTATAFYPQPAASSSTATIVKDTDSVLICNSDGSYAYHSYYCRGLKRCKSGVLKVTLATAKKKGKNKPCGYCYK